MTTSKAGKTRARHPNSGFTLFELLVAIAIAALAMGLVVSQLRRSLDWDLKNASSQLARTIRFLYNDAATRNLTIRMVFNFESSTYSVESSSDAFSLIHEEFGKPDSKKKKEAALTAASTVKKEEKEETVKPVEPVFSPIELPVVKEVRLPEGIYFKDIDTEHQSERMTAGVAYLYFFPQGYVERAVINLRDEKDEVHYSLQVNPISGAVKIEPEYLSSEQKK